jgi:hypothetical protein
MTVDPHNLHFLYQGVSRSATAPNYSQIPYHLALLNASDASHSADDSTGEN